MSSKCRRRGDPGLPSSYCLAASAAFLKRETKAFGEMKKCARGDAIVIPARSASAVVRLCAFSKSIVVTPPRRMRHPDA
jgi:hypothetical protein